MDDLVPVVSTVQVGITAIGILTGALGAAGPRPARDVLPRPWRSSPFAVVTYVMALIGELGVPTTLIGHPLGGAADGVVVSASTTAGRGPASLVRARASVRPAPPGGVRCRQRRQDVAPMRARQ